MIFSQQLLPVAGIAGRTYCQQAITSSSTEDGILLLLLPIVCDTTHKSHDYELYMDICLSGVSSDLNYEMVINSLEVLLGISDNALHTLGRNSSYFHRLWILWNKDSINFENCLRNLKHGNSRFQSKAHEVNVMRMNRSNQTSQNPCIEALQEGCAHSLLKHLNSTKHRNLEDFGRQLRVCTIAVHFLLLTQEKPTAHLARELITQLQVMYVPQKKDLFDDRNRPNSFFISSLVCSQNAFAMFAVCHQIRAWMAGAGFLFGFGLLATGSG